MATTDALFDPDARDFTDLGARTSDPETSHQAAANVNGPRDRDRAFRALAEHGPMTDFALGALIDRQQTSAGKRRKELLDDGLVEWTGERLGSPSGALARVWGLTVEGIKLAEQQWGTG